MKLRILLSLSLSLVWPVLPQSFAQSADDFFHNGAVNYLSNNIPKALQVVTNGRALFPDDIKLKKLEELLRQQNQQQQQQQQQNQQDKQDQQQQKQDSPSQEQKQQEQPKPDEKQQQDQQQPKPGKQKEEKQSSEEQQREARAMAAAQMTPEQAKQLMDSVRGDERLLIFKPEQKARNREHPLKDW